MNAKMFLFLIYLMLGIFNISQTQIYPNHSNLPKVKTPEFSGFKPMVLPSYQTTPRSLNRIPLQHQQESERRRLQQQRNQAIIRETRQDYLRAHPEELYPRICTFPALQHLQGTQAYRQTFVILKEMLENKQTLNVRKAVFLVENAFVNQSLNYEEFSGVFEDLKQICLQQIQKEGLEASNLVKNMMIVRLISDTTHYKHPKTQQKMTLYPMRYDFEDFMAQQRWDNMFVIKLLHTGKGQCHSMPLFYMLMAEALDTEAYLAYSPSHSYIRFATSPKHWINFETTASAFITDASILQSGYVSAEALANKIYMQNMGKKEVIAACLLDLAQGFARKYGADQFYLDCVTLALQHNPKDIVGLMMKSNYYVSLLQYMAQQTQHLPPISLDKWEAGKALVEKTNQAYQTVQAMGYRAMPAQVYQDWRKSVDKAKAQTLKQKLNQSLLNYKK